MTSSLFRLLRVRQALKNLLVFAAPIAAYKFDDTELLRGTTLLFVAFSALSFGVYALNDVADIDDDRLHPIKMHRPIAAGEISPKSAILVGLLLIASGFGITLMVAKHAASLALLYVILNFLYSSWLKHVPIVELVIVASGFVIRVLAGLVITPGPRTPDFMLVVFFGSILVVVAKRASEQISAPRSRRVLADYPPDFLRILLGVSATAFVLSYISFAFDQVGETWEPHDLGIGLTVAPLFYVVAELTRLAVCGEAGEPEYVFIRNFKVLMAIMIFVLFYSSGILLR